MNDKTKGRLLGLGLLIGAGLILRAEKKEEEERKARELERRNRQLLLDQEVIKQAIKNMNSMNNM